MNFVKLVWGLFEKYGWMGQQDFDELVMAEVCNRWQLPEDLTVRFLMAHFGSSEVCAKITTRAAERFPFQVQS